MGLDRVVSCYTWFVSHESPFYGLDSSSIDTYHHPLSVEVLHCDIGGGGHCGLESLECGVVGDSCGIDMFIATNNVRIELRIEVEESRMDIRREKTAGTT